MILSCDIGTSSLKLGIIDCTGVLRFYARLPIKRPSASAWWNAFRGAALAVPDGLRKCVRAVGVSGNAPTLVPIDRRGRPLADPLMWYDAADVAHSGRASDSYFLPAAERLARNRPWIYDRTDSFLPSGEYLVFVLTGNKTAFIPHDAYEPYYWNSDSAARYGLDLSKFPPLERIGRPAGGLTEHASRLTGLPARIPVFCGGADFLMALLGAGAVEAGRANDRGGTSEALNYCSGEAAYAPLFRTVPGFLPGTWNLGGFVTNAGRYHAVLKDALVGKRGSYEAFAALADTVTTGSSAVYFRPPRPPQCDVPRRHALSFLFGGMTGETAAGEYVQSFFLYLCFSLRRLVEALEKKGCGLSVLICSGGLSRNTRLNRLKADVIGKPVIIPMIEDSELLGNACVAFAGIGDCGSSEEAARAFVQKKAEYEPRFLKKGQYDDRYGEYCVRLEKTHGAAPE